jgi:hypothetical protein
LIKIGSALDPVEIGIMLGVTQREELTATDSWSEKGLRRLALLCLTNLRK